MSKASDRPTYQITLRAKPGVAGDASVRALRGLLKALGRSYGLQCLDVTRVKAETPRDDDQ